MMNWGLSYIRIFMKAMYGSFYVIFEGIFKISHSWPPIISIVGAISILITFPLFSLFIWGYLYWSGNDISTNLQTLICIGMCCIVCFLLYKYYLPSHKKIEQKIDSQKIKVKILLGVLALAITVGLISLDSYIFEAYHAYWRSLNYYYSPLEGI